MLDENTGYSLLTRRSAIERGDQSTHVPFPERMPPPEA